MRLRVLFLLCAAALAGCATGQSGTDISSVRFGSGAKATGVARSNLDLADDFLDLTYGLENGEKLDGLLRYETPVRVYLRSSGLQSYRRDLEDLLQRLRREAGLDIAETRDPDEAQIFIEAVATRKIARVFPSAACFIVPGKLTWREFIRDRGNSRIRWSEQKTLTNSVIFLPLDSTPQDTRDCLNEEITQALGPANDLYRLPDSVWNDDNFHGQATAFDMLILKALYQPELHSGMSHAETRARLPKVFNRINPRGRGVRRRARHPESAEWAGAIEIALSQRTPGNERFSGSLEATRLASEMRPEDHRLGVSLLTLGRLSLSDDPQMAADHFSGAYRLFRSQFGTDDIRTAQAGVNIAALSLGADQLDLALALADRHVKTAIRGQNAILVAGLLSIKAEALRRQGRTEAAGQARLDSLRWARYGFGDDNGKLAREQAKLTALLPELKEQ